MRFGRVKINCNSLRKLQKFEMKTKMFFQLLTNNFREQNIKHSNAKITFMIRNLKVHHNTTVKQCVMNFL